MEARKQKQDDQVFFRVSNNLMRLGPNLIYGPNRGIRRSLPQSKKRDDSIFRDAFEGLLQITPDTFKETAVSGLGLKISTKN